MKLKWKYLRGRKVRPDVLAGFENRQRLETYDIRIKDVSPQDRACAAFFVYTVGELVNQRDIWTRQRAGQSAEPYLSAAKLCRREMHEPLPMVNAELATALSMTAQYLEDQAGLRQQNPYIVERSSKARGDDKVRALVRLLAAQAFTLWGSFLYGVIATVASIAFERTVSPRNVRNWCEGLKPKAPEPRPPLPAETDEPLHKRPNSSASSDPAY
jgi:hypothetical protein